jgi:hypothetical protein
MLRRHLLILTGTLTLLCGSPVIAREPTSLRVGYLDDPGSALVLLADARGLFRTEQLQVTLTRLASPDEGLAALESGVIQAATLPAATALRAISRGSELKIIAAGGTPKDGGLLAEVNQGLQLEQQQREIVTVVPGKKGAPGKTEAVQLVSALIRAHQAMQHDEQQAWRLIGKKLTKPAVTASFTFDPNPDYYRLATLWQGLGLQRPEMARDFLAGHVYEEIYCDALDRIIVDSDLNDPVLQQLFRKAICVPNCCPAFTGKLFTIQGGTAQ